MSGPVARRPRRASARRGSLTVVGTGIALVVHATTETLAEIRSADKVFYVVGEGASAAWLRQLNPSASSLDDLYGVGKPRWKTYRDMADRVLAAVRSGLKVCAVFYGHPGVFVNPGHDAIRRARREGFSARMLPGISAEDCLFADLGVDPFDCGCQSYEATDFLASRRRFDPTSALILWQVGFLGESSVRPAMQCRPERLRALVRTLRRSYPATHPVVIYEAAQLPICDPVIVRTHLGRLSRHVVRTFATLYIAPRRPRPADPAILRWYAEPDPRTDTTAPRSASGRAASSSRSRRRRS